MKIKCLFKNKKETRKYNKINKKIVVNGSYSVAVTAVFIVAVIVINLIVNALPSKYTQIDMSDQKLYSIGEQTKSFLDGLDEDVTIYQVAQSGSEDQNISQLLEKYKDESSHIKVEKKDPVVNPGFVQEFTSENLSANSLIVVSGERSKVVKYGDMYKSEMDYNTYSYNTTEFDAEGQITGAISYVTSEELPVVYTLEGHGETEISGSLKDSVEKANIELKTLNLLAEGAVPDDADCLIVAAPATDISAEEKDYVLDYLENGGKALLISGYSENELKNYKELIGNYGVSIADGIVFEGDNQRYAMQVPYYLLPQVNSTDLSENVASSGYYILMPYARGIQKDEEVRDSVQIESVLTTSDSSYSKTNMKSEQIQKEENDIAGPFDLGVAITESVGEKETKIAIYSSNAILDSQVNQMVSGGNEMLLMSSLKWMVDTENLSSVSVPSKSLEVSYLTLTDYDASFWKICTIGIIPGVFLVMGFLVWFKRRNR